MNTRHVYVKICWKCACNLQSGLWDLVTYISLWTSKWGVTKLTFRVTFMCWWVHCWCNITRCCPIYTCRTNTELSKIPIFDSITKTCNNICLVCDGVEFQCQLHSTTPWERKQLKLGLKWKIQQKGKVQFIKESN